MPPKSTSSSSKGRGPSNAVKLYLTLFNLASFFGWMLILTSLIKHLIAGPQTSTYPIKFSSKLLAPLRPFRIFHAPSYAHLPPLIANILDRCSNTHLYIGSLVALVQSAALLEIVHVIVGWVKSPVPTTAIQVASRLFMVWAVSERYSQAWTSPFYATMIFAWSVTEAIRYPFYANQLMGSNAKGLLWARYTTFYLLYPLGAGSEAMLIFSTLPQFLPWNKPTVWSIRDYVFLLLFIIWWPGLYVMYTHMIKQRRRALGKGFWGSKGIEKTPSKKTN
ncbi:PTPLA-domain-containing protein [Violaceomyces palustris]|uniref:PTPLA-domain-containing protein n=1 Tax=Violaceomyces palustris TaxID=1673888 RepID=A0ACD0P8N4_9BASI|nr:PTPLA-domain-containing protein [Violaceomyces palustris]